MADLDAMSARRISKIRMQQIILSMNRDEKMGRPKVEGYKEKGFPNWKTEMTRYEFLKALRQKEANLDQFIKVRTFDLEKIRKQIIGLEKELSEPRRNN